MSGDIPLVQAPIIIFAFARPDYLRRLCLSLKAQQGVLVDEASIHLLQDGTKSRRSGITYGDPALIEASIAAFREVFPRGQVHAAPENLGIAMNLLRGERLAFQTLRADIGYFFEEDLELGPAYLAMMEALAARFGSHRQLGYFAAYGDHRRVADPAHPQIVPLEHHWGFGLTRHCWQAMQGWLKPFHQVYQQVDYQARPHLRIVELYGACRVSSMASSQDVAKTMACADLGFARINTDIGFARYIGAVGESFRAERFASQGFAEAPMAETMPETLPEGGAALLEQIAAEKFEACAAHRRDAYDRELATMRRSFFNPDRPVTREELEGLWRLLMDRLPTDESYYEKNVGVRTLRQVRRSLLRSREAQGKGFYLG